MKRIRYNTKCSIMQNVHKMARNALNMPIFALFYAVLCCFSLILHVYVLLNMYSCIVFIYFYLSLFILIYIIIINIFNLYHTVLVRYTAEFFI
jgi:uncharacterized Tic20 family protein